MNDIEILEDFIEDYVHGDFIIQDRVMRAIENLIKENKKLKEKNKKITENCAKFIEGRDTVIQQNRKETLDYVKENYIPKSKVREIIINYSVPKKDNERIMRWEQVEPFLEKLEELLED